MVRECLLATDALVRAVVSGRRRNATVPYRRVELRYVDVKAGRLLQVTSYDETQAHTRNVAPGAEAEAAIDELLATAYANWHVETTSETLQLRVTKKGRWLLHRSSREADDGVDRSHDRAKQRQLDESDPLFALLGITSADGRGEAEPDGEVPPGPGPAPCPRAAGRRRRCSSGRAMPCRMSGRCGWSISGAATPT